MNTSKHLHAKAVELSQDYLRKEGALLTLLMEMQETRAFLALGYTGIFNYCLHGLKFSESQANYFSSVARKSREIPELKQAIDNGVLSISKARRIVKVITPATQEEWIAKASQLSQVQIDREVAAVNPSAVRERVKPISSDRHEIRLSISDNCKAKLDRVRALSKAVSLEETLEILLNVYLDKKDPVKKAERTLSRKVRPPTTQRTMPAAVRSAVHLRDRGKCQVAGCSNQHYVELHHRKPRAEGGLHTVENLVTLCSAHHRMRHLS